MVSRRVILNATWYYCVSTQRQGRSGLGIDAQKKAVPDFLDGGPWSLVAAFEEYETGRDNDRPKLQDAMALCRVRNATRRPLAAAGRSRLPGSVDSAIHKA